MIASCFLWVLSYVGLFRVPLWFRHVHFPYKAIVIEYVSAGILLVAAIFLRRHKKFAGFAATLGLSRLLYLAIRFPGSTTLLQFLFHVYLAGLSVRQVETYPAAIGLGIFWFLQMAALESPLAPYAGKKFLKDADRLAKGGKPLYCLGTGMGGLATIGAAERSKHLQIIGPTGSGKTQLILGLAYQDMLRGMPVFFMEAKGDQGDFDAFRRLAEFAGRSGDVVYFNPVHPDSLTYNPIRTIRGSRDPIGLANQLSRAIGREPGGATDGEHYRSLDFARFVDLAEVLLSMGEPFTLRDIFAYFSSENGRAKLFQRCKDKSLIDAANLGLKANGGDLSSILAHIKPWVSGGLGRLINDPDPAITLEEIFEERKLAYFAVPVGQMPLQTNALGRMVISNLLAYAQARQLGRDRSPAGVYLDEFPEFVTPAFSTLISTVRSAGIWACLSHQDLGQLKRIDGMDKEAFTANVLANTGGAKVFFKMISPEDAERVAAMMGTKKSRVTTRQIKTGLLFGGPTGVGTEADKETFRIHPNELKSLQPFRAAVHLGDAKPVVLSTPRLYEIWRPA